MNYDVFIPVRLSSQRLPKKAMKELNGKPIIKYLIERLQLTKNIRFIVVCTTTQDSDNELVEFLTREGIKVFRGREKDILYRFLDAANKFDTDFIVEVDGDDICTDPSYVDKIVEEFEKTNADYIQVIGVPVGFTPIGIKKSALEKICKLKKTDDTATGWGRFFTETGLFKIHDFKPDLRVEFPKNLRLSLDFQGDFDVIKEIIRLLGNNFHIEDVLKLLKEQPYLIKIIRDLESQWNKHWDENLVDISIRET